GGIVAAIISVSFFLLMLKRKAFLKWSFALIGIFIILLTYSPSINEIFFTYLRLETNSSRNAYWQTGIEIVKDYPLTGTGANLFDTYFYSYSPRITINILN